jgi:hypothetical protein
LYFHIDVSKGTIGALKYEFLKLEGSTQAQGRIPKDSLYSFIVPKYSASEWFNGPTFNCRIFNEKIKKSKIMCLTSKILRR